MELATGRLVDGADADRVRAAVVDEPSVTFQAQAGKTYQISYLPRSETRRILGYLKQNRSTTRLTPRQRRRIMHKRNKLEQYGKEAK